MRGGGEARMRGGGEARIQLLRHMLLRIHGGPAGTYEPRLLYAATACTYGPRAEDD
jgi:hypothetical protein